MTLQVQGQGVDFGSRLFGIRASHCDRELLKEVQAKVRLCVWQRPCDGISIGIKFDGYLSQACFENQGVSL